MVELSNKLFQTFVQNFSSDRSSRGQTEILYDEGEYLGVKSSTRGKTSLKRKGGTG